MSVYISLMPDFTDDEIKDWARRMRQRDEARARPRLPGLHEDLGAALLSIMGENERASEAILRLVRERDDARTDRDNAVHERDEHRRQLKAVADALGEDRGPRSVPLAEAVGRVMNALAEARREMARLR